MNPKTLPHNSFSNFVKEINSTFRQMYGCGVDAIFTEVLRGSDAKRDWFCIFSNILDLPWVGYVLPSARHAQLKRRFKFVDIEFKESKQKKICYRVFYTQRETIGVSINTFVRMLSRQLEINFRTMIENLADEMKLVSIGTRDLPSFFHKSLRDVLPKYLQFDGASAFYYDENSDALTLGSTTGLVMQEGSNDFRRQAIKYYLDEDSATVDCYISEKCTFEFSKGEKLGQTSFAEKTTEVFQRTYFPIMIRNALIEKAQEEFSRGEVGEHAVGVLRILNVSTYGLKSPLSLINYCILKHFCETLSILGARYQIASRVLHDMERATHGFSTDLTTLRLAVQLAHRYQDSFANNEALLLQDILTDKDRDSMNEKLKLFLSGSSTMRREVDIQLQNALSVQDSMAFQVLNVHMHSERSAFGDRFQEKAVCFEPYREVFMRVSGSLDAMSQTYDRQRVKLKWEKPHNSKGVQDLPALSVPAELLYLVVRNLIENSIKYCPVNRQPRVGIDWRVLGGKIEFGFRDNGIGISPLDASKIFRDGWRAREANELSFRGNGLGLAVCKSVLGDFGGELEYVGRGLSGRGSQFNLKVGVHS